MERTWRWFGKNDKITLAMLKEIGVEGIVTALHDVPNGEVWTREKIRDLKEYIESYGMRWSVVESLPVVESIKYAGADRDEQIERYKESLRNNPADNETRYNYVLCKRLQKNQKNQNDKKQNKDDNKDKKNKDKKQENKDNQQQKIRKQLQ